METDMQNAKVLQGRRNGIMLRMELVAKSPNKLVFSGTKKHLWAQTKRNVHWLHQRVVSQQEPSILLSEIEGKLWPSKFFLPFKSVNRDTSSGEASEASLLIRMCFGTGLSVNIH